jgi:hypothetical protein
MIKKLLFVIVVLAFLMNGNTQIKIGNNPTVINSNSLIEFETTNKGLLLPRVGLIATNVATPLTAHIQGMVVYNTSTTGTPPNNVEPGFYYNDGTKWVATAKVPVASVINDWTANQNIEVNEIKKMEMLGSIVTMVNTGGARTTNSTFDATEASAWQYVGQSTVAAITYPANEFVLKGVMWESNLDGRVWRRSGPTGLINTTQNAIEMLNWEPETNVTNSVVINSWILKNQLFEATVGGSSSALIRYIGTPKLQISIDVDAVNYETVSQVNIGTFQPNKGYPKNHIIFENGSYYFRLNGGIANTSFENDAGNWQLMHGDVKPWIASHSYRNGELASIVMGGVTVIIRSSSNRTSLSAFDAAEIINWVYVSQQNIPTSYPTSQPVMAGFKFTPFEGSATYKFTTNNVTTNFVADNANYTLEGSGVSVNYQKTGTPYAPYTISIAKSAAGLFEFFEDPSIKFGMTAGNQFQVLSKTSQGVTVWGIEDETFEAQQQITATNAPVINGSFFIQTANTYFTRGNVAMDSDYDEFAVFHVACQSSNSIYRVTIHGAGGFRNYIIERWKMDSVSNNSKVTLSY